VLSGRSVAIFWTDLTAQLPGSITKMKAVNSSKTMTDTRLYGVSFDHSCFLSYLTLFEILKRKRLDLILITIKDEGSGWRSG
jgi:hypothetical protein